MAQVVSPAKLAHVVLWTRQIQQMRDWYGTVLGARVVHANPFAVFMTYDDEHHRVALAHPQGVAMAKEHLGGIPDGLPGTDRPVGDLTPQQVAELPAHGLSHVAFAYDTLEDLLGTYERLKKESVLPASKINHGTTTSIYYNDPDGNSIELQIDNFDTVDEGTAFMESESFARNPIGVEFDPEEMLDRLRAGESASDLIRPTW
ncbi:VOC family protein [Pseudonocardia alaniniphila]